MSTGFRHLVVTATLALMAAPALGQAPPPDELIMVETGIRVSLGINRDRGYRAFPIERLEVADWTVAQTAAGASATAPDGTVVSFVVGSPFFRWGDQLFHLTDAPYRLGRRVWVPVQLLIDFLPRQMPGRYAIDPQTGGLLIRQPAVSAETLSEQGAFVFPAAGGAATDTTPMSMPVRELRQVVVIDAGHGGRDGGVTSALEVLEKDVTLSFALAAAAELRRRGAYDVYVTRGGDEFVELWERGELATEWRGEAPGIFVSIHANSSPDVSARGVETYFLADARTDHVVRIAALENEIQARFPRRGGRGARGGQADLAPLLADLRNDDLQRWSAHLASVIQREVGRIHPGPSRGVKQGPFAVLTNTMMPSVLLEVGFLTNPEDSAVLQRSAFHRETAVAIANGIDRFFLGYPPGPPGPPGDPQ